MKTKIMDTKRERTSNYPRCDACEGKQLSIPINWSATCLRALLLRVKLLTEILPTENKHDM